jgi:hypothetical protein
MICFEAPRDCRFQLCCHSACCASCAESWMRRSGTCIFCRSRIEKIVACGPNEPIYLASARDFAVAAAVAAAGPGEIGTPESRISQGPPCVVFDIGQSTVRAGFAEEDAPRLVTQNYFWKTRGSVFRRGILPPTHIDEAASLWENAYRHLGVTPSQQPVRWCWIGVPEPLCLTQ